MVQNQLKKFVSFVLIFLSFNINASIFQLGIPNLTQLDKSEIIELISGNQLTGFQLFDGEIEGLVIQTFYKNGEYKIIFEESVYEGFWKVKNNKYCSKKKTSRHYYCFYWYTGSIESETFAYIVEDEEVIYQFHAFKSLIQVNQEKKKIEEENFKIAISKRKEEVKKITIARIAKEEKRKAEEAKRIADAKKAEEKRKAEEAKRIADAKKAEEKRIKIINSMTPKDRERERLKNFQTVYMNCTYPVNGTNLSYSWAYDGKKLYWEGAPINIGTNNIDQGFTINVIKVPGKDKFQINIDMTLWIYNFENDFYNRNSVIDFYGMKGFGNCY